MSDDCFIGIDIGTSGVRAIVIDAVGRVLAQAAVAMPPPQRDGVAIEQDPVIWWGAVVEVLIGLTPQVDATKIRAIAVDGTSGTLLLTDAAGKPLTPGLMYNDTRSIEQLARIKSIAPPQSACHGASSALARLLYLQAQTPAACHALHQADWIAGRLSGQYGFSDENNALKTGYDVISRSWPDWFDALEVRRELLPAVLAPGTATATIDEQIASTLGLPKTVSIVAGTTDGVAAFLATGAKDIGDAVTSLGTTLVVKILSDQPLFVPQFGIYSHRLGDLWLPGGASNSGGAALLRHFDSAAMQRMTPQLDPERATGLHYYPLPSPGERFPINDPQLQPRIEPRPDDDVVFFQALLEGIAEVERQAYRRMQSLGAPFPRSLRSVGGGASNSAWTRIRQRALDDVAMAEPIHTEAAYGTALLARRGATTGEAP